MSFTVDGLASGLDTSTIIRQLMQIERQPVQRMIGRQNLFNARVNAWSEIDTALGSLKTAVNDLRQVLDFNEFNASSSNEDVFTASASSAASKGSFSFSVEALAAAHQKISEGFANTSALVGTGVATFSSGLSTLDVTSVDASTGGLPNGAFDIEITDVSGGSATVTFDGVEQTVSSTGSVTLTSPSGSITLNIGTELTVGEATVTVVNTDATTTVANLRSAINNAGGGLSATIINTGSGSTPVKLIATASESGLDNALTLDVSGLSGFTTGFTDLRAAADLQLAIGGGAETITRSSNTVTDLIAGVTLNIAKADPGTEVTVDVTHDDGAIADKTQALVDALNNVRTIINKHAKYNVATQKGGVLVGDSRVRQIDARLREAMSFTDATLDYSYASSVGISIDSTGKYSLDRSKLTTALDTNFTDVMKFFTEDTSTGRVGLAGTLHDTLDPILTAGGLLDTARDGAQTTVKTLQEQIDAFDDRLVGVEARYRRQFTALETALAQLASQGNFIGTQLASLLR